MKATIAPSGTSLPSSIVSYLPPPSTPPYAVVVGTSLESTTTATPRVKSPERRGRRVHSEWAEVLDQVFGVSNPASVLRKYGEGTVIEAFNRWRDLDDHLAIRNPAGWLVWMCRQIIQEATDDD